MRYLAIAVLVLLSIFWVISAFSTESTLEFILFMITAGVNAALALLITNLEDNE